MFSCAFSFYCEKYLIKKPIRIQSTISPPNTLRINALFPSCIHIWYKGPQGNAVFFSKNVQVFNAGVPYSTLGDSNMQ